MERQLPKSILPINVGVLGHVDSGKVFDLVVSNSFFRLLSLGYHDILYNIYNRAISNKLSTCALDKHPQSKKRGITLDLGFSAFLSDVPEGYKSIIPFDSIQFTLVDCPGHATLIKSIIGGASIIDIILLVIDINKGVQTQTSESIVLAEVVTNEIIVVLNKIDLIYENKDEKVHKTKLKLRKLFSSTKFGQSVPIVATAANIGGDWLNNKEFRADVTELTDTLFSSLRVPERLLVNSPFIAAIDHSFSVRGHGIVLTGTVLSGHSAVGDMIELPQYQIVKKIKSLQVFHSPVNQIKQGDRVGICVQSFDTEIADRSIACSPGTLMPYSTCIATISKIRFYGNPVQSYSKFHITCGHSSILANIILFGYSMTNSEEKKNGFFPDPPLKLIQWSDDYLLFKDLPNSSSIFVVIEFESPMISQPNSIYIGSKLDTPSDTKSCRLAFYGHIIEPVSGDYMNRLSLFKERRREGIIDRVIDSHTVIGNKLFDKDADMNRFVGFSVGLSTRIDQVGVIQSGFGKGSKIKIRFQKELEQNDKNSKILLSFKRFLSGPKKDQISQ